MPMKPQQMIRLLKKHGFHEVSKGGGHRRFVDEGEKHMTEVPMHSRELKPGIQRAILQQAGIKQDK